MSKNNSTSTSYETNSFQSFQDYKRSYKNNENQKKIKKIKAVKSNDLIIDENLDVFEVDSENFTEENFIFVEKFKSRNGIVEAGKKKRLIIKFPIKLISGKTIPGRIIFCSKSGYIIKKDIPDLGGKIKETAEITASEIIKKIKEAFPKKQKAEITA